MSPITLALFCIGALLFLFLVFVVFNIKRTRKLQSTYIRELRNHLQQQKEERLRGQKEKKSGYAPSPPTPSKKKYKTPEVSSISRARSKEIGEAYERLRGEEQIIDLFKYAASEPTPSHSSHDSSSSSDYVSHDHSSSNSHDLHSSHDHDSSHGFGGSFDSGSFDGGGSDGGGGDF